jgi:acyl-coenzyme A thioesterase 13
LGFSGIIPPMSSDEHARKVADRVARLANSSGFDGTCGFRPVSWGDGKARVEMVVAPVVQNINGHLHGGATAALVDNAGTLAIVTADREARPGVTTDLNVTYLAPGPGGSTVVADATVLKIGKTMAFVTVDVRRATDGALIAQGRMTKFQG